jgi:hypothetical protein
MYEVVVHVFQIQTTDEMCQSLARSTQAAFKFLIDYHVTVFKLHKKLIFCVLLVTLRTPESYSTYCYMLADSQNCEANRDDHCVGMALQTQPLLGSGSVDDT